MAKVDEMQTMPPPPRAAAGTIVLPAYTADPSVAPPAWVQVSKDALVPGPMDRQSLESRSFKWKLEVEGPRALALPKTTPKNPGIVRCEPDDDVCFGISTTFYAVQRTLDFVGSVLGSAAGTKSLTVIPYYSPRVQGGATSFKTGELFLGYHGRLSDKGSVTPVPYSEMLSYNIDAFSRGIDKLVASGAPQPVIESTRRDLAWNRAALSHPGAAVQQKLEAPKSFDVVSHETVHNILNAMRPRLGETYQGSAIGEALADTLSFLVALGEQDVRRRVLAETGGDLHKPSELVRHNEQDGRLMASVNAPASEYVVVGGVPTLRSLQNDAKFDSDAAARVDQHGSGAPVSGALYELFVGVYERERKSGKGAEAALLAARTQVVRLILEAVCYLPEHVRSVQAFATALVLADHDLEDGKNQALLNLSLGRHQLLQASPSQFVRLRDAQRPKVVVAPTQGDSVAAQQIRAAFPEIFEQFGNASEIQRIGPNLRGRVVRFAWPPRDPRIPRLATAATFVFDRKGRLVAMNVDPGL